MRHVGELFADERQIVGIGRDEYVGRRYEAGYALIRLLKERSASAEEVDKLFWFAAAAARP